MSFSRQARALFSDERNQSTGIALAMGLYSEQTNVIGKLYSEEIQTMERIFVLTTALLILVACAPTLTATPPPTALATATALPTNTPPAIPTVTATALPLGTPTATKEPTFAVAGLNPDQYPPVGLANAAITQYARAVNLKVEAVTLQANQRKDQKGNSSTVAATVDGTPLMIWNEKDGWRKTMLKDSGFPIGTLLSGTGYYTARKLYNEFNAASIDYDSQWFRIQPQPGDHVFTRQPDRSVDAETFTTFALGNGMTIYGGSLIYRAAYPRIVQVCFCKKA